MSNDPYSTSHLYTDEGFITCIHNQEEVGVFINDDVWLIKFKCKQYDYGDGYYMYDTFTLLAAQDGDGKDVPVTPEMAEIAKKQFESGDDEPYQYDLSYDDRELWG